MTKETQAFVLRVVSIVCGTVLIAVAFAVPGIDGAVRIAVASAGGVLAGLPINPFAPKADKKDLSE